MNLIVVPRKIKLGLYSIMIEEQGEELIAICGGCGQKLSQPLKNYCAESEWMFCSESCMMEWIKNNKPEDDY